MKWHEEGRGKVYLGQDLQPKDFQSCRLSLSDLVLIRYSQRIHTTQPLPLLFLLFISLSLTGYNSLTPSVVFFVPRFIYLFFFFFFLLLIIFFFFIFVYSIACNQKKSSFVAAPSRGKVSYGIKYMEVAWMESELNRYPYRRHLL